MRKYTFKVGDRVRVRLLDDMQKERGLDEDDDISRGSDAACFSKGMRHLCGRTETITKVYTANYANVELDFDDKSGRINWKYCPYMLEPVQQTIVIYRKGSEVIALDKRTGKKASAKCSPEDTFNFEIGARLAFDRLIGEAQPKTENKPQHWSGKLVCVKGNRAGITIGKVYTVKNGKLKDDDGEERPKDKFIESADGYNGSFYQFVEYKGEA